MVLGSGFGVIGPESEVIGVCTYLLSLSCYLFFLVSIADGR